MLWFELERYPLPLLGPATVAPARLLLSPPALRILYGVAEPLLPPPFLIFPAGPVAKDGLFLRSYRIPGGLEATAQLDPKYCAFPGELGGRVAVPAVVWE